MKGLSSSRSHHQMVACDPSFDSMGHHLDHKPYLISQIDNPHPTEHSYYNQRSPYQPDCVVPYGTFPRRHYNSQHELKDETAVVPYTGGGVQANKGQCVPVPLLDHYDRQLPVPRDGYHTLQYKRAAAALEQRSDSPGRIRHLVHSVQKLFTKSHSLEGPHHAHAHGKGSMNGGKASPDGEPPAIRHRKRSKSRERCKSAEPKNRTPPSGYWSSDELEREACLFHHGPPGIMTMGRHPDKSQSQYFLESYNTINDQALKNSRSSNDIGKCSTCMPLSVDATQLVKKSSWSSSLTVSRARQVYQKASVNVDKALVKAEACQQERSCQFLQVPQDEWGGFPMGKEEDIPCRRMRSGSYVKAMAEDDSGDSDGSPKPSPKMQARRASYLKATQPSLTEMTTLKISQEHSPKLQIRSHSYLRAVSEVEVNGQIEAVCESVFREMESQAVDALDLPVPGCFRMRSHSYVRAIDQGCSQDDEGPLLPASPPRTTTTVRTIQSSTVSSCITTYKKTPPPVPPRTSTKPFISITAQSSTESAQDAYMDGPGTRGEPVLHSGLSNSTESIDSMKALTAAIEAANAQIHGPASQHVSNSTVTISTSPSSPLPMPLPVPIPIPAVEDLRRDVLRKSRCLSIGIQVDGPEDEEEDPSKFQSVGVQVEEEHGHRRFTRSNSVTAAVQADLDTPDYTPADSPVTDFPSSGCMSRQYSRDAATSTVSIQGSGNHYHACTSDDYEDVGFDPSILPPPDPWIDSVTEDHLEIVGRSVCQRDGRWFLKLLQAETERMEGWCRQMEQDEKENKLPDEILGKIRSAVGSAQLLMSQKFQQFRELCEENLQNPNAHPRPVAQDLAGFWDMLQLSIENISLKFDELHQLKANNWRPLDPPERKERRLPPPVPKKPPKGHPPLARDRSLESTEKQRQEARKRLMAAKRAASVRQNSATESADSIEIYIPEAQTRL
ncbi:disks large-associated protein 1 isoform X4 [Misgurnus anguillicaudatus]|uniref:disks large-associated protein 1 isoform X4 n=1 Tax=Misgurnus anguillicaudatus TaxID=75329 RepID=UPI0024351CC2|nr:disks large-associated protein 1 isoform X4 [Misgurnus anguillicaudatus]